MTTYTEDIRVLEDVALREGNAHGREEGGAWYATCGKSPSEVLRMETEGNLPWLDLSGQMADGLTPDQVVCRIVRKAEAWTGFLDRESQTYLVDLYQESYNEGLRREIRVLAHHDLLIPRGR